MCLRHKCHSRVWCWLVYTSKIERSGGDSVDVSVTCPEVGSPIMMSYWSSPLLIIQEIYE